MAYSHNRSVAKILSVAGLAVSFYLLAEFSSRIISNPQLYLPLMPAVVSGFNIPILFAYLGFGLFGGIATGVTSILVVLWFDARTGMSGYSLFTFTFLVTIFMGFWHGSVKNKITSSFNIEFEKLNEKMNIVSNEIELKKHGIMSLEEKLKRYYTLKEAIETVSTNLSLDYITRLLVEQALNTLGKAGRVLLFLVDTEKQDLMLSASHGDVRIMTKTGDIFDHWVLKHRQSLIVEDIDKDFRFPSDDAKELGRFFSSLIATPLVSEDKIIGILRMDSLEECRYTQDDLRLLDIIAHLGAVAIANAFLYSKTEELAIKDSVTGLFVRRYFFERFREELQRAAIRKETLSLLVLDIDHFKNYNDKYGHAAGDLVLRYLSKLVNGMVREGDIVARYGGEEIVVLLNGRSKKETIVQADEIRRAIKSKPLTLRRHVANITVSIGLASYPDDGVLEEDLVRLADKRLYKAKKDGRNRVCSA